MTFYLFRIGIWLSCGLNTLTGGSPFITTSAANYSRQLEGRRNFVWLIDGLFFWEKAHCEASWLRHQERIQEWRTQ